MRIKAAIKAGMSYQPLGDLWRKTSSPDVSSDPADLEMIDS